MLLQFEDSRSVMLLVISRPVCKQFLHGSCEAYASL